MWISFYNLLHKNPFDFGSAIRSICCWIERNMNKAKREFKKKHKKILNKVSEWVRERANQVREYRVRFFEDKFDSHNSWRNGNCAMIHSNFNVQLQDLHWEKNEQTDMK